MKDNNKLKTKHSPQDWSFLVIIPVLIIVMGIVMYFVHSMVTDWYNMVFIAVESAVDWGIIFPVIALWVLIVLIFPGKISSFFRRWNRLLGTFVLLFAAWGILAFIDQSVKYGGLGGSFGYSIIGDYNIWGVLRIFGFLILGFALLVPSLLPPKIKALLTPKKDAAPTNMKSESTQQSSEPQKIEEVTSGIETNMKANAKPKSKLKMNCRECGKELVGTPEYCRYCGTKDPIESRFCPKCGSTTYEAAEFCTKCGNKLIET